MMVRRWVMAAGLISAVLLSGAEQDEVPLLRWAGPPGTRPGTFREWIALHPYTDFYYRLDKRVTGDGKAGTVAIITEQSIAPSLTAEIDQLINNLQLEGYTVGSYQVLGGTPEDLRSFLQGLHTTDNIEGALFIGNLPIAWFQVKNDFNYFGYREWPIDLFYMDLNGDWLDTLKYDPSDTLIPGQDSIYDTHSGHLAPEIYIGRLMPTGIGDDTLLIKNYLSKNNAYRQGNIELQHRALVYVDDDWIPWAPQWAADVALLYSDTLVLFDGNTTRASDYRVRLDTVRAWVSVFAHSWPAAHSFDYNNQTEIDYYWSTEYTSQDPPANFYNHFACSFARYTAAGYGGGHSIFNASHGVGSIGSTKIGSMLDFYYFYLPLSQGKTIGEAFRDWFIHIASGGITFNELCWHYGMTLLGDPFLLPTGHNLPAPPCTLNVVDVGGVPGSSDNSTDIELDNSMGIGGVEFILEFDGSLLIADSIIATPRASHMDIGYNIWPDSLKVVIYSLCGDSIVPGEGSIVQVLFNVDASAGLGDSTLLQLKNCVLSDPNAQPITCISQDGWFYFIPPLTPPSLIAPDSGLYITDITPTFIWHASVGATKYRIKIDFDSIEISDTTYISSPLSEGTHSWCVKAGDAFDNWSGYSGIWVITVDTIPPVIDSTTDLPDTVGFFGPFTVRTKLTDNFSIKDVVLYFRINSGEWVADTMAGSGNWYEGEIPEQTPADTIIVNYYVTASDSAGNLSRDPEETDYSFTLFLTGIEEMRDIPDRFVLFVPRPNPSVGMVELKYGLPERADIGLSIYDIQGRLVDVVYRGKRDAGYHKLKIDSRDLSSGIYFIRFQTPGSTHLKKLIILR